MNVVNAGADRIAIGLRSTDPEHVQDDLGVLLIVLISAIVKRLPGSSESDR